MFWKWNQTRFFQKTEFILFKFKRMISFLSKYIFNTGALREKGLEMNMSPSSFFSKATIWILQRQHLIKWNLKLEHIVVSCVLNVQPETGNRTDFIGRLISTWTWLFRTFGVSQFAIHCLQTRSSILLLWLCFLYNQVVPSFFRFLLKFSCFYKARDMLMTVSLSGLYLRSDYSLCILKTFMIWHFAVTAAEVLISVCIVVILPKMKLEVYLYAFCPPNDQLHKPLFSLYIFLLSLCRAEAMRISEDKRPCRSVQVRVFGRWWLNLICSRVDIGGKREPIFPCYNGSVLGDQWGQITSIPVLQSWYFD